MENTKTLNFSDKFKIQTTNVALLDAAILGGVLAVLNYFTVGMKDWGWMTVNPSPWLLLPLFMGARYGFGWGIVIGALTAAMILFVRMGVTIAVGDQNQRLLPLFTDHLFFYLCLPAVGFITGETTGLLAKKLGNLESKAVDLEAEKSMLESELEIAQESRFQLQERLALFGAEQSSLDQKLRAIFEPTAGAIFPNLLRLLRDVSGITDAAIYAVTGAQLERIAALGNSAKLPERLSLQETEIARLAVERKTLTTCKEVWQEAPDMNSPFIAVLPWMGQGGKAAALLMIHRMDFLAATWRNFQRIQMICRWVAQFVELKVQASNDPNKLAGSTGALIVSPKAQQRTLGLAAQTHRDWRLPSTLATFEFIEAVPQNVAALLPKTIATVMRPTDVGSFESDGERPVFRILFSMEGVREAESIVDKALRAIAGVPQIAGKVAANLAMTDSGHPA